MENKNQIVPDISQLFTRCGKHKPNYTWLSFLYQIWRAQAKLYLIYDNFVRDMENTSQIILDMSFLHQIWRIKAKLYLIYVNFAPDMENTRQIILDIYQFCNSYGEHMPNYILYVSILHQILITHAKLYFIYVNCAPDVEKTIQIIFDMCQFCTRYGEHESNYI